MIFSLVFHVVKLDKLSVGMPCLDIDLYRNAHTHTRNRGIRTLLHTCMHRYARSSLRVHTGHTFCHIHAHVHEHTRAHTCPPPAHTHIHIHTHMCSANTERQVCTSTGERHYPWFPAISTASPDQKHKKIKVTNSRVSRPVYVVCKRRQNIL